MTLPRFAALLLVVAAPLAAFGCNKGSGEGAGPAPSASAANGDAEAKTIFEQRCTPCHGASGRGDGAAASALTTKPRDYTNADWQKTVTDDDLRKVIVKGGKAVGKSELMPPNPDLETKPAVVDGLVKIVRGFSGKGGPAPSASASAAASVAPSVSASASASAAPSVSASASASASAKPSASAPAAASAAKK
jgi:cell division septation protein DedD